MPVKSNSPATSGELNVDSVDRSDAFGMPTSLGGATGAMKLDQASSYAATVAK